MSRKTTAIRFSCAWLLIFLLLIIFARGIGTFSFEKRICNISDCIVSMESVNEVQAGSVYEPQNENAYLLFDLAKAANDGAYGITLKLNEKVKTGNFVAYFGEDVEAFSQDDAYKVYIEKNGTINLLSTRKINYAKLVFDKILDIDQAEIVIKTGMTKVYVVSVLVSTILSLIYIYIDQKRLLLNKAKKVNLKNSIKTLFARRNVITFAIVLAEVFIVCCIEVVCYLTISGVHLNPVRAVMISSICMSITVVIRHRESILRHFHVFYFFFVMMVGTVNILGTPYTLDLSWDDQIHYSRSNYISRGFKSLDSEAGYQLSVNSIEMGSLRKENFTSEKRETLAEFMESVENDTSYDGLRSVGSNKIDRATVSYITTGIGLAFGRGLGMSATLVLLFGKWVNLLCYSAIMSYAIYLLRNRGYIITAFIGLIPTSVFLASSYSYDWWVLSLTILGYALYINAMQTHNEVSAKVLTKIMIIMLLALLPKPVYFPIVLPMLVLKTSEGKKDNKKGLWAVFGVIILLILVFAIPVIKGKGVAYNDTRGSLEVNSAEQLKFILTQPFSYAIILLRFLWGYINPDNCQITFGFLTAYGNGSYYTIVLILLTISAVVDNISWKEKENRIVNKMRMFSGVGIFGALVLISTAFYIAYTAVRSEIIDGVQCRYCIPLIFPLIYYVCRVNIDVPQRTKDKVLLVGCLLMAVVFYYNIYFGCLMYY